ncbi:helix-turn-helix domain-containing protein [Conexibacter sp. CPCC 206217]|uniref:AraC family transcriptional regulator n=1 Tax=Conexibacter sp. CPCC 206217 TaxID=3064574 RepID=UPI00272332CF|nr:helix-turn-helix domain-containing protein [Conexibacter sp. CPCC 206217]MDO8213796.1 helix-turn-helix domain-containing protein [Conexibacter sp. CPCC 206217]
MSGATRGILEPDTGQATFRLARHAPALDLRDVIAQHWTVAWDLRGRPPFAQQILTHPNVNLSFEPDGAFVWGVGTTSTSHELRGRGWVLGTRFLPGGFRPFADVAVATLTDRIVPLHELVGRGAAERLERRVRGEETTPARIAHVEAFLRNRHDGGDARVAEVAAIVQLLLDEPQIRRVDQLAARCHVSTRTLQRLFHEYVGVSPKWVVQRHRLQTAAERIAEQPALDLAGLAVDLGYFDQAHFIKEFKGVIGRTPAEYAGACAAAARMMAA